MLLNQAVAMFDSHMKTVDRSEATIKGYILVLKAFSNFLSYKYNGPIYMEEIRLQDLEDYLLELKNRNLQPASRSRCIYIIKAFFNYCCKKEILTSNISDKLETIQVPERERIYLTPEEMKHLISSIEKPIVRLILNTLYYTGLRISECLSLQTGDVDLDNRVLSVRNTKSKKDRQVPINAQLIPQLASYRDQRPIDTACTNFFIANRVHGISPDYLNRTLKEACRQLGWNKKITCHSLRHSFASTLVANNVSIVNIQKLLGHQNLATTSIYTHTNLAELTNAVNSML